VLGIFLHAFVIRTAEMNAFMFGRDIYPRSFLLAAVITMIFSALVNVVMGRKMRHIDMAESMKAVD
jgi:putative ABC transport system permease protein